ncbi:MAG TPA: M28 family metallopeptidase [Pyrinomonadaceae bacterium]|nr:M28 family metallopeptidase [Pyrinomonadaceae bacterium]
MPASQINRFQRLALALSSLVCVAFLTACPKDANRPTPARVKVASPSPTPAAIVPAAVAFNGERAMEHVKKQIEVGPRISGSAELEKTRAYVIGLLTSYGLKIRTDEFTVDTPIGEKKMMNITAELSGESKDVIVIASHYETKYFKDMLFVGANDPASSVATLLEIARVLATGQYKPKMTYWFVLFDGEEAFCLEWDECSKPGAPDNTYGSRYYVSQLQKQKELERVRAMILLDLMGYKNLELGRDTLSTRWLQDIIWNSGRELGHKKVFVDRDEGVGGDDHEPFLQAGVDAVDIIQLNGYPYWHRADDTIDKVSARSMKIVGDTVLASLPKIEEQLLKKK